MPSSAGASSGFAHDVPPPSVVCRLPPLSLYLGYLSDCEAMVQIDAADLEALKASLDPENAPYTLDDLVERLARLAVARAAGMRAYNPGETYRIGERILFRGHTVDVLDVRPGGNPSQGTFHVLELKLEDGSVQRVAASIPGTPRGAEAPYNLDEVAEAVSLTQKEDLRQRLLSDLEIRALVAEEPGSRGTDVGSPLHGQRPRPRAVGLFAEHLVDELIDGSVLDADLAARGDQCLDLLGRVLNDQDHAVSSTVDQTWRALISPMLRTLGWRILPLEGQMCFALAPDPADLLASQLTSQREWVDDARVIVVPMALGGGRGGGQVSGDAGGLSPLFYLVEALWEQRARWGILTDGVTWRLYASSRGDPDVGSILNEYYEVSLAELLETPQSPSRQLALRRWLRLFSVHAWHTGRDGLTLLEVLKQQTARYADAAVAGLQRVLWEQVVPSIAGGFAAYLRSTAEPPLAREDLSQEALAAALTLIQVVITLLYAEHLRVLPVEHPDYRALSMTSLVHDAAAAIQEGRAFSRSLTKTPRYLALLDLLSLIKGGAPTGTSAFEAGGSLAFAIDPVEEQRLARFRLSDEALVRGLAPLAALDGKEVDWSALTWRHLTSLLGGLLESRLWVTDARAGQAALVDTSSLSLEPVRRVMPDPINMMALEHTMTSLLRERAQRYWDAMDQRSKAQLQLDSVSSRGVDVVSKRVAVLSLSHDVQEALLGVRVLDSAMGAGEYLMAALDLLADGMVAAIARYYRTHPWMVWSDDPIHRTLHVSAVHQEGWDTERAECDEVALLMGWLCEHCLHGVDLNPLAILLARQVFMMRVAAMGLRVSHPPRFYCGDSLRAVFITDYLDGESEIVSVAREIWRQLSVWTSSQEEPRIDGERQAIIGLGLDLLWAYHQGLAAATDLVRNYETELSAALRGDAPLSADVREKLERLQDQIRGQRPMCWESTFPEVFLRHISSRAGQQPGFDAVVGNPPPIGIRRTLPGWVVNYAVGSYEDDSVVQGLSFADVAHRVVRRPGGRVSLVVVPPRG